MGSQRLNTWGAGVGAGIVAAGGLQIRAVAEAERIGQGRLGTDGRYRRATSAGSRNDRDLDLLENSSFSSCRWKRDALICVQASKVLTTPACVGIPPTVRQLWKR